MQQSGPHPSLPLPPREAAVTSELYDRDVIERGREREREREREALSARNELRMNR